MPTTIGRAEVEYVVNYGSLSRTLADTERKIRRSSQNMATATGQFDRSFVQTERNVSAAGRRMAAVFRTLGTAVVAFGGVLVVRQLTRYADAFTGIENQIATVIKSTDDLNATTTRLFDIANRARVAIEPIAGLYQRASLAADELGISQQRLEGFVETTAKALATQAGGAGAASGALLQLGQALGAGVVRAEEFNSILEGALPIAQAAARGWAGGAISVAELREQVIEGAVSSKEFFEAIERGGAGVGEIFDKTTATLGQATTVLNNALTELVGGLDDASGASGAAAQAIIRFAEQLRDPAFKEFADDALAGIIDAAAGAASAIVELNSAIEGMRSAFGLGLGLMQKFGEQLSALGNIAKQVTGFISDVAESGGGLPAQVRLLEAAVAMEDSITEAQRRSNEARKEAEDAAYRQSAAYGNANEATARYIQLAEDADAAAPGARIGGSLKEIADAASESKEEVEKLTGALARLQQAGENIQFKPNLELERATALGERTLPGVLEDSGVSARLQEQQEVTDQMNAAAERAREGQQSLQREFNATQLIAVSASGQIADALLSVADSGKTAGERIIGVFEGIIDAIARAVIQTLIYNAVVSAVSSFQPFGGAPPIPQLKPAIPGLQHGGRARRDEPYLVGERGPELFVPDTSGTVISNADAIPKTSSQVVPNEGGVGGGSGGNITINYAPDLRGAAPGVAAAARQEIVRAMPFIRAEIQDAFSRRPGARAAAGLGRR